MINIKEKSDIVIPFHKVGEKGWIENSRRILQSVFHSWGTSMEELTFKSDADLEALEKNLGTTIPESLKLFYTTFGAPSKINEHWGELDIIGRLSDVWDIDSTSFEGPDFSEEEKKILPHLISFSDYFSNSIVFCFHDETKEIYYFNLKQKPYLTKAFDTADDFIKSCLICDQIELYDTEVGQKQVEIWIKEVMQESFGSHVSNIWFL